MNYTIFYKNTGIHKLAHLVTPKLLIESEFLFPDKSILFHFEISDVFVPITSSIGYLTNVKRPAVITPVELSSEMPLLGRYKVKPSNQSKIITQLKRSERKFKFIKPGATALQLSNKTVLVYNYGSINSLLDYSPHRQNLYYKWRNAFGTMLKHARGDNTSKTRTKFISLSLPNYVLRKSYLDKYVSRIVDSDFKNITTYETLNVIELVRFLSLEHRKNSVIYNTIPRDEYKNINLILRYSGRVAVLNLEYLYGLIKDNKGYVPFKPMQEDQAIKLIYIFLKRFREVKPLGLEEIDNQPIQSKRIKLEGIHGLETNPGIEEVDLDEIVDEYHDDINVDEVDLDASTDEILDSVEVSEDISIEEVETGKTLVDKSKITKEVQLLKDAKVMSPATAKRLSKLLEEQNQQKSNYIPGLTVGESLTDNPEDYKVNAEDKQLADSPEVFDKTMLRDTLGALNKQYIKKTFKKDIVSVIYGLQNSNYIVESHDVEVEESILGGIETHSIKITSLDGKASSNTIKVKLPVLSEDGTFRMSGNNYLMRKQRTDLPIKKITPTRVGLNSYYGKLNITKATYKRDDAGFSFCTKLINDYDMADTDIKDLITVPVDNVDQEVPYHYGMISRYIKGYKYKGYHFHFEFATRGTEFNIEEPEKLETKGSVLVGMNGKKPVLMNTNNELLVDGKSEGTIFDVMEFPIDHLPVEFASLRVYKNQIPVVVVLSYYLGFNTILKLTKVKYQVHDAGTRVKLEDNQYVAKFNDKNIIFTKDYGKNDMLFGGLIIMDKITQQVNISTLYNKSDFGALFNAMDLPILYVNEIKLLDELYIDPITQGILVDLKLPTTFTGLLFKAIEMLLNDNYRDPKTLHDMVLKGNERIAGMLYKELVTSIKIKKNKSHFGSAKLEFNPYSILGSINEDSTVVLQDDLNPIAMLKQYEDVTYLGANGRSEATMSEATRAMHSSDIGVVSEGVKDSGAVGISAYLVADPKIANTRGLIDEYDIDKDGWSSTVSTSAMLSPFGIKDDVKRLNFAGIQNGHIIPMSEMRVPYVITGYETVITQRVPDKFAVAASHDGKVLSVSKSKITVEYDNKKSNKKEKVDYVLKTWLSKEEANTVYKHSVITSLKKGDKFVKGDTITYDKTFFRPSIFDKSKVMLVLGNYITVALSEDSNTYEDSGTISRKVYTKLRADVTKVKSLIINNTDSVIKPLSVGDEVEPNTPLLTITDANLFGDQELDEKTIAILESIKNATPKAGYRGKLFKLVVYYNCDTKDMTKSLRKLVKLSDERLVADTGYTGRVNSSYSIQGKPLLENEIEIKFYIDTVENMGTADKAIFSNQLKFTVGEVYDYSIVGEKTGTVVDANFSTRSIKARIVNSADLIGVTSMLLEEVTRQAVDMYFE